ncbi:hypothetical protein TcasGA2_TC034964 [Tribolium castaneum]|uniref:Uncharacterized protein n=2 Tax=Tribolium castaneum TaxID=7070 RepID=A0A139W9Q5_TRICA|nr:PREDICTED: uncharacterized protein LOC103313068 [Tribolium castaneum]XP_008200557.1 PREDICTED: uncharacterized protein LOC103314969 [Tribolium castaneum]KYB24643.1 hypothetical protein TcasGA2_TC034964 [Tribolium castaneum]|eukprot:XP_008193590.1 PREDICTED: uncharacterized protein LOC103313068 [Tribolium castaneum]
MGQPAKSNVKITTSKYYQQQITFIFSSVTFLAFIEEHKIRKTMVQEKRYGVDSRLIDELKVLQLKRRKRAMFQQLAFVSFNNGGETEMMVTASHKRITVDLIQNCRPPVQEIDRIDDTTVEIVMSVALFIRIRFRSAASLDAFKRTLGDLAENDSSSSSSSEESNGSTSPEGSQTSVSTTDETMLTLPGEI